MKYMMYMTPTLEEAKKIQAIAYLLLHTQKGDPALELFTAKLNNEKPIIRESQYGEPGGEVHFGVGTKSYAAMKQPENWDAAIKLYHCWPYWIALPVAWVIFCWNCLNHERQK